MVTINLLPVKAELRKRALIEHAAILGFCVIVAILLLSTIQGSLNSKKDYLNAEIASTKVEINKLAKEAEKIEEFKKRKQDLERKLEIIANLKTQKSGPVEVLDQLSLIIPEKAWVNSIKNSGNSLVLDGYAVDNPTIAQFLKRLQASQYFSDVVLVLSQQDGPRHKFTIKCRITLPS